MGYAENTSVSVEKSRAEIERTLQRYGADQFVYGWNADRAVVGFVMENRQIKFEIDLPARAEFDLTPTGKKRASNAALSAWEQACRQRWRALALVIKAKLEAVESGITEFEDEFLAHIVLPDGSTAGRWMRPQIARAYDKGTMPSMLPALGPGS